MQITLQKIRQAGLTMSELSRRAQVPYHRIFREINGGLVHGLKAEEVERIEKALQEAATAA